MKQLSIQLPDELGELLEAERQRRAVTTEDLVQAALVAYLQEDEASAPPIPFVGLGRSGRGDIASRAEEYLDAGWQNAGNR
jgi:hypothetical protein